jgi:hypothetical protein
MAIGPGPSVTSGMSVRPDTMPTHAVLWLVTVLHFLLASVPGLSVDEAHYGLYGLHFDWSYFDHPPLVGWLNALVIHVLGPDEWSLRLPAVLIWLWTAYLAIDLFEQVRVDTGTRPHSVLHLHPIVWVWLATPMTHVLGIALIPDTLLMPLTLLVMRQTYRLTHPLMPAHKSMKPWLLLGLYLGLAGLAKYSAVFLAIGVAIIFIRTDGWRLGRQRGLWLATLVALVLVSPVMVWNQQHQGLSLVYQFQHAHLASAPAFHVAWSSFTQALSHMGRFVLVSLLVFGLGHMGLVRWGVPFRQWHLDPKPWNTLNPSNSSNPWRWTWAFSLPLGLVLLYAGMQSGPLPHWWVPVFMAALPGLAWRLSPVSQQQRPWGWGLYGIYGLYGIQLVMVGSLYWGMVSGGWSEERSAASTTRPLPMNPFADLYGWPEAAAQAVRIAKQEGASTLAVSNWTLASRLAWYGQPWPVKVLAPDLSQFTLWFGQLQPHEKAVWVNFSAMPFPVPLNVPPAYWSHCNPQPGLSTEVQGRVISHFDFFVCQ